MIPKPGSAKRRRLGIPTARDRTVQAALKLVLEPIFEGGFQAGELRLAPRTPGSGRDRRDPPVHLSWL
jgi:RNA-directed DNA polymerase